MSKIELTDADVAALRRVMQLPLRSMQLEFHLPRRDGPWELELEDEKGFWYGIGETIADAVESAETER